MHSFLAATLIYTDYWHIYDNYIIKYTPIG